MLRIFLKFIQFEFLPIDIKTSIRIKANKINIVFILFTSIFLLILKFSKRPDDGWVLPVSIISLIAFFSQILQITFQNLLIQNNNLVIVSYLVPFFILGLTIFFLINENFNFLKLIKNVR